jgi:hypothetical protein
MNGLASSAVCEAYLRYFPAFLPMVQWRGFDLLNAADPPRRTTFVPDAFER